MLELRGELSCGILTADFLEVAGVAAKGGGGLPPQHSKPWRKVERSVFFGSGLRVGVCCGPPKGHCMIELRGELRCGFLTADFLEVAGVAAKGGRGLPHSRPWRRGGRSLRP